MTAQEAGAARGWVSTWSSPLFSQHRAARGTLWPEAGWTPSCPLLAVSAVTGTWLFVAALRRFVCLSTALYHLNTYFS